MIIGLQLAIAVLLAASPPDYTDHPELRHRVDLAYRSLDQKTIVVLNILSTGEFQGSDACYAHDKVVVKRRTHHGWKAVAAYVPKNHPEDPEADPWEILNPELRVGDFDCDGRPEIAVIRNYPFNSGGPPGDVRIYRYSHRRLRLLGEIQGNQGIWVTHLNGSRRTQFVNSYEIGDTCSHGEMPRWPDVYEVHGNRLIQVNARFPRFYEKERRLIRELLSRHPGDRSLWAYYGYAAAYARAKARPASVYRSVYRDAVRYFRTPSYRDDVEDKAEFLAGASMLLRWAKPNRPYPRAHEPFLWYGRYMLPDQSPWRNPPRRRR